MRIALISQEYPPETAKGGIGTQTFQKANGLSKAGHEVIVISRSLTEQRYEQRDGPVRVIRIPGMESFLPSMNEIIQWMSYSLAIAAEIEKLSSVQKFDIIDFPEWGAEGYAYLVNRTTWNYTPTVIQLHGPLIMLAHTIDWPEMNSVFFREGTRMEATAVQLADEVYSSSICSARWVQEYYDQNRKTIPVIHTGVDTDRFAPSHLPRNPYPTILFAGKIVENKGVEDLINALALLIKDFPSIRLRLLGKLEDNYRQKLVMKAQELDITGHIEFPGFINKEELPGEFAMAHMFAAPSWYEGGPGFVYLEAMACGLPVLACSGSGIEEIINGENGLLVEPKRPDLIAQSISGILKDELLLHNMSQNARNYVLKNADSKLCLDKLEKFYFSVIERNKSRVSI
jgi:glycogen(starch) synthase